MGYWYEKPLEAISIKIKLKNDIFKARRNVAKM